MKKILNNVKHTHPICTFANIISFGKIATIKFLKWSVEEDVWVFDISMFDGRVFMIF